MVRIFEQARQSPDKPAVVYNGSPYGYASLARWIEGARRFLAQQGLPPGTVAVLCLANYLDAWVLGLALRSLGFTTIAARDAGQAGSFRLRNISGVVASAADSRPDLPATCVESGWRLIRVPSAIRL